MKTNSVSRTLITVAAAAMVGALACASSDAPQNASASSSRRFKEDIAYVSRSQLDELEQEVLKIRLATFRYKGGDRARHLGFIIEDSPDIAASDVAHAKVDLYAFASMAIAALQVQAREIEQLQADVDALAGEVEAVTGRRSPLSALSSPRIVAVPNRRYP